MCDEFFDFNGDGKVDPGEEFCAYMMFEECMKEENEPEVGTSYGRPKRGISGWEWFGIILLLLCSFFEIVSLFN